jgi:hypothetical protein
MSSEITRRTVLEHRLHGLRIDPGRGHGEFELTSRHTPSYLALGTAEQPPGFVGGKAEPIAGVAPW